MSELRKKFGIRLKELRKKKGFTQVELAKRVGLSASFISNVERGINSPSFENLESISEVLEVDIQELFIFTYTASKDE